MKFLNILVLTISLFVSLITFISSNAHANSTFDLNWSGSSFGNSATAVGQLTLDPTGVSYLTNSNAGPGAGFGLASAIGFISFLITVTGATSGNGTFTLQAGDTFRLHTPTPLNTNIQLIGQDVSGGRYDIWSG